MMKVMAPFRWPPSLQIGAIILAFEVLAAVFAELIHPGDPQDLVGLPFLRPGADPEYPLGTDLLGRDITAGLLYGARITMLVGASATAVSLIIGTTLGLAAGYFGGLLDHVVMRVTELFQAIPHFLFAIVLVAVMGATVTHIVLAIGLTSWPMVARLVRAEALSLRERDFIKASAAMGAGHGRLLFVHILPNALPPVVTVISILGAMAVLTEVGLSFLGLGDNNSVSWGSMIGAGRESLREAPYIALIPGAAVVLTILSLSLIGDGVSRIFNPKAVR
ncbi:ABC transporter permease [Tardiphaga sp. 804_B3_N1_9]|uniref:ABC transporter permease n=1 Tax=Tardiphaga sp. 804_B3_N1_9 TaxID=3240786 RepID=UPI003F1FFDF9